MTQAPQLCKHDFHTIGIGCVVLLILGSVEAGRNTVLLLEQSGEVEGFLETADMSDFGDVVPLRNRQPVGSCPQPFVCQIFVRSDSQFFFKQLDQIIIAERQRMQIFAQIIITI